MVSRTTLWRRQRRTKAFMNERIWYHNPAESFQYDEYLLTSLVFLLYPSLASI